MLLSPLPVAGSDLHVEPLFREALHVVCMPEHPVARLAKVRKKDLAGARFLSLDRRHHSHRQVQAACEELGATMLDDYEGTSLDSLRQMCGSGLGFALLPELYLRSEVGGENLVTRLALSDWRTSRSIAAVWRSGAAYAEHYRVIADSIAAEARRILKPSPEFPSR
jgi:LysR family hydrogen peroxide-inducible transcriptional activator